MDVFPLYFLDNLMAEKVEASPDGDEGMGVLRNSKAK